MNPDLVSRIYECAFLPELWPNVLADLATITDARGGVLFTANPAAGVLRWSASKALQEDMATYVSGGWLMRGSRLGNLTRSPRAGFVIEHDIYGEQELANDPTYRDFLRPLGLGWAAGTAVSLPTNDMLVLSIEREYSRGPVELEIVAKLDALRPHLARSALMSARLQMERATAVSQTLGLIGLPAMVLNERAKVIAANTLVENLVNHIRWRAHDEIALKDPAAETMFRRALASLNTEVAPSVRSFALRSSDEGQPLVAHILPLRGSARDLFSRSAGVLVLTPVTAPQAPPVELVQSLFDLTAAEARVARSLAAGDTLQEIAAEGNVTHNTVRTQLRGVMDKTGCRRQAEVVALLSGIGTPGAR